MSPGAEPLVPAQEASSQVKREEALCARSQRGLEERAAPAEPITGERPPPPGREGKGSAGSAAPKPLSAVCAGLSGESRGWGAGGVAELEDPHGTQMWHTAWRFASTSGPGLFGSLFLGIPAGQHFTRRCGWGAVWVPEACTWPGSIRGCSLRAPLAAVRVAWRAPLRWH